MNRDCIGVYLCLAFASGFTLCLLLSYLTSVRAVPMSQQQQPVIIAPPARQADEKRPVIRQPVWEEN